MQNFLSHHAVVPWVVAGTVSLVAALIDLRSRRIPNWLTGAALLGGMIWSIQIAGVAGIGESAMGALIAGGPFVLIWLSGGGGAGDAKLMLAIGAWLWPRHAAVTMLAVAVVGGVLAVGYAIAQRRLLSAVWGTGEAFLNLSTAVAHPNRTIESSERPVIRHGARSVPYGVAILGGVCTAAAWVVL